MLLQYLCVKVTIFNIIVEGFLHILYVILFLFYSLFCLRLFLLCKLKSIVTYWSVQLIQRILTKEALEGLGDFKIGGQIIHTVKYADDLMLLAKEKKVLQDMIDKLIEIGRCYGM